MMLLVGRRCGTQLGMKSGIDVGWSERLKTERASNVLAQWLEPLESDIALSVNGAHGYCVHCVRQCNMHLLDARGDLSVLVAVASDCAVAGANGNFVAFKGIFAGHDGFVNHTLAGTSVPDSEKVQRRNLTLLSTSGKCLLLRGFSRWRRSYIKGCSVIWLRVTSL